jgi:hypothetical protein
MVALLLMVQSTVLPCKHRTQAKDIEKLGLSMSVAVCCDIEACGVVQEDVSP